MSWSLVWAYGFTADCHHLGGGGGAPFAGWLLKVRKVWYAVLIRFRPYGVSCSVMGWCLCTVASTGNQYHRRRSAFLRVQPHSRMVLPVGCNARILEWLGSPLRMLDCLFWPTNGLVCGLWFSRRSWWRLLSIALMKLGTRGSCSGCALRYLPFFVDSFFVPT